MSSFDPLWVAPRSGQDWRDEDVPRATDWLKSFVPAFEWERRIEHAAHWLEAAKAERIAGGRPTELHDPADLIAWLIFQAETFATDRMHWVPEVAAHIVPVMKRIGADLPLLKEIEGVEARAERLMTSEKRQPYAGFFELLVALAYRRRGWSGVRFVPEQPGGPQTPDLVASRSRRRWAVECKRMGTSAYEKTEKARGEAIAQAVHDLALSAGRSVIVEVVYRQELVSVPDDHLIPYVEAFLRDARTSTWRTDLSEGRIREVNWRLAHAVLGRDYVYFGSSRMIELLVGKYLHEASHSLSARWRPWREHSLYADAVYQASVVSWLSGSSDAVNKKARHFRSVVAKAEAQLPPDMPGVIHVGVGMATSQLVEATRHLQNRWELRDFRPATSRLRWVYSNIFAPEVTTRQDESWALNETTIPYRIGRHSTSEPLPGHSLLTPDTDMRPGVHWDGYSDS